MHKIVFHYLSGSEMGIEIHSTVGGNDNGAVRAIVSHAVTVAMGMFSRLGQRQGNHLRAPALRKARANQVVQYTDRENVSIYFK